MKITDLRTAGMRLASLSWRASVIVLIGSAAGLTYNAFSDAGVPLQTPDRLSSSDRISWSLYLEDLDLSLSEAKDAHDAGTALFIDARSSRSFAAGHIPGALSLPVGRFRKDGRKLLADIPKGTRIITYCSGSGCQTSISLANMLTTQLGYERTRAFYGGWRDWVSAGYPIEKGSAP